MVLHLKLTSKKICTIVDIGGFNQRQGEALPPQIFLTLKFLVWAKLQNDDVLLQ